MLDIIKDKLKTLLKHTVICAVLVAIFVLIMSIYTVNLINNVKYKYEETNPYLAAPVTPVSSTWDNYVIVSLPQVIETDIARLTNCVYYPEINLLAFGVLHNPIVYDFPAHFDMKLIGMTGEEYELVPAGREYYFYQRLSKYYVTDVNFDDIFKLSVIPKENI